MSDSPAPIQAVRRRVPYDLAKHPYYAIVRPARPTYSEGQLSAATRLASRCWDRGYGLAEVRAISRCWVDHTPGLR